MENDIDLKSLLVYFWKKKSLILLIALMCFGLVNLYFFTVKGYTYSNVGKVQISTKFTTSTFVNYRDILLSDTVIDKAIKNTNINANKAYVKSNLSVNGNENSQIYTIRLYYKDKEEGKLLCRSIIDEFISQVFEFDGSRSSVFEEVNTSNDPINFSVVKNELIYALIGLLGGFGVTFIMFFFDNRIKSESELEKYSILGTIYNSKDSVALIANKIKLNDLGNVVLFTSPKEDYKKEIKDILKELSKDAKVIFIDTNIRNTSCKKKGYFDLLSDGKNSVAKCIKNSGGYDSLECGTKNKNIEKLLSSDNNKKLIATLAQKYDYVVLFSSDTIDYADSLILSKLCDRNYILVGINKTNKQDFRKVVESYQQINNEINGIIVINK